MKNFENGQDLKKSKSTRRITQSSSYIFVNDNFRELRKFLFCLCMFMVLQLFCFFLHTIFIHFKSFFFFNDISRQIIHFRRNL